MSKTAIQIKGLKKSYNNALALKGVDIEISKGEFFGLLGPNGAGKTTTINILTGLVFKDAGTCLVFEKDIVKDYRYTRSKIGIAAQELSVDWFFTIEKLLYFQAGYYGISSKKAKTKVNELLGRLGLDKKRDSRLRQLSGGMKRRLAIARSLMGSPTVIVLDEPSTGLDPQSRNRVWEELAILKDSGVTVLLSTHYMEEAATLCDRLSIMDQGKILDEGTPDQMILKHAPQKVAQVRVAPGSLRRVRDYLRKNEISFREVGALISVTEAEGVAPDLSELDEVDGVRTSYRVGNLEDVFLTLTGRELRDG